MAEHRAGWRRSAISPKQSPGPIVAPLRPRMDTRAVPSSITSTRAPDRPGAAGPCRRGPRSRLSGGDQSELPFPQFERSCTSKSLDGSCSAGAPVAHRAKLPRCVVAWTRPPAIACGNPSESPARVTACSPARRLRGIPRIRVSDDLPYLPISPGPPLTQARVQRQSAASPLPLVAARRHPLVVDIVDLRHFDAEALPGCRDVIPALPLALDSAIDVAFEGAKRRMVLELRMKHGRQRVEIPGVQSIRRQLDLFDPCPATPRDAAPPASG